MESCKSIEQKYENFCHIYSKEANKIPNLPIKLNDKLEKYVQDLLHANPLDKPSNEMLLLHGTKPENQYSILLDGLDTGLACRGLYGRGIYSADDPSKVEQYITMDKQWKGAGKIAIIHFIKYMRNYMVAV